MKKKKTTFPSTFLYIFDVNVVSPVVLHYVHKHLRLIQANITQFDGA